MSKKKKTNSQPLLSPENYIRQRARNLEIAECRITQDWESGTMVAIIVSRKHSNGNYTFGLYLVDKMLLGVKDTFFIFNESPNYYQEVLSKYFQGDEPEQIDYTLAHNIIYGAVEFAEAAGFRAHKDFYSLTQYLLQPDDENIELIDIKFGTNGKHHYFKSPFDNQNRVNSIMKTLEKNLGEGNYYYTIVEDDSNWNDDNDEEWDDDDDEEPNGEKEENQKP